MDVLGLVLLRAFLEVYDGDFEVDGVTVNEPGRSKLAECKGFTMLCSVCTYWHLTLSDSSTSQWLKHRLSNAIQRELRIVFNVNRTCYSC